MPAIMQEPLCPGSPGWVRVDTSLLLSIFQDCTICMERLTAPSGYKGPQPTVKPDLVGKLSRCGHIYHIYCLVAMYNNGNKVSVCGGWGGGLSHGLSLGVLALP